MSDVNDFTLDQGPIKVSYAWLNRFIGEVIDKQEVENILLSLGFTVKEGTDEIEVTIPTWRATKDISNKADIAEEISRIHGYDNLNPQMPLVAIKPPQANELRDLERRIKTLLIGAPALSEVYNYSFVGEEQLSKLGLDYTDYIRVKNPIASHMTLMRQNLSTNMFEAVKTNQARYERISIFEIGRVYLGVDGSDAMSSQSKAKLPWQERRLNITLAAESSVDVYSEVKGIVEYLLGAFGLKIKFENSDLQAAWADPEYAAQIISNGKVIGSLNQILPATAGKINLKKRTSSAEINLEALLELIMTRQQKTFIPFDKFPPVMRDLALVVNKKVAYNDLNEAIRSFSETIRNVELFDIYQGDKIGKENKSLAFHVIYQAERTMKSAEIDKLQTELVSMLGKRFDAQVRDF